ncbi:MAG: dTDP-4-dehydrorhamnose reductase [Candidatus Omnitrophota bacterium]|nr:dTDP-4-dehydrorhamnose reductase [Candidatus Omnitrophota bacterium]
MYKKILITGAKGMLGSILCRTLSPFYSVIAIDKEDCDITDKEKVESFFNKLSIDVLIHCAAYTEVDKAEDEPQKAFLINAQGTKNVIEALKGKDCFLIYISTDYVFDGKKPQAYLEADIPNPQGVYAQSKLEGERVISAYTKHAILRTSWVFGPNGKNFVDTIVRLAKEKEILEVVSDQIGSPTYTLDLSEAIKAMLDIYFARGLKYGIYHITNSGKCSWFEFAQFIIQLVNLKTVVKPISSECLHKKAKRPKNSLLSNEKFHSLAGYCLPSWQEAVKNYLDSIKNNYDYSDYKNNLRD